MGRPSGFTRKPSELTKYRITRAKQKLITTQAQVVEIVTLINELEATLKEQEAAE